MEERISETDLILPSLYFIEKETGITTSKLKILLTELFKPTGRDAQIAKNRGDTYFDQKVRNLVSHDTLEKKGYTEYRKVGNNGTHHITDIGRFFLQENIDTMNYLLSGDFSASDVQSSLIKVTKQKQEKIQIYDENLLIEEGTRVTRNTQMYERSRRLHDIAIEHYTVNGHLECTACKFDFYVYYGETGRGYIEIHHQKPIFQYGDQDSTMFIEQALQNVAPVCSNCHRMIHRKKNLPLTLEELKFIIQKAKV